MSTLTPLPTGPRNIILLLDGTSNQFSDHNTNLIKTLSVIRSDEAQLVYYSSGIGTVLPDSNSSWGQVKQETAKLVDQALAINFDEFVCNAYKYLMDHYRTGDKIYLFGFSRGAYTARALAGMIQRVGLLPAGNHNQVTLAYAMYTSPQLPAGSTEKDPAVQYRRIFDRSRPVTIEFMGVWDTVSSIGGFDLPLLPFASGASTIKLFRHALALDERRARFIPEYWRHDGHEATLRHQIADLKAPKASSLFRPADPNIPQQLAAAEKELKEQYPNTASVGTGASKKDMVKNIECWFMGCHSDVGGGAALNDVPCLSNIPFRWMLREAAQCGLLLNPEGVAAQSALILSPSTAPTASAPSAATLAALARLRSLLDIQAHDAHCEAEQEPEVDKLRKTLTQDELVKVVEAAAAIDADAKLLSKDEMAGVNESLEGPWLAMELLLLKTRQYTKDGAKEEDVLKINNGQGRQIIPGEYKGLAILAGKAAYGGPAAKVAQGWPEWADVRKGKAVGDAIWVQ